MFNKDYLSKLLYFQRLKNITSEKDYEPILQSFIQQAKLHYLPKDRFVFKYKLKIDYFLILLKGRCLKLIPKSHDQLTQEIKELEFKFPGIQRIPQNFYLNPNTKTLSFKGKENYPKENLVILQDQLNQLNIQSFQMLSLMAHLIEGHVVRFQSALIINEDDALIESITKNAQCTIITLDNCEFLQLQVQQYLEIIETSKRRKNEKIEYLMCRAFQDGIKYPDFKRVLQELINSSERIKLCNHQNLYSFEMQSHYVYLILKGEFYVSYSSHNNNFEVQCCGSDTQYDRFRKTLRHDQKQVKQLIRYPIQINESTFELLKQANKHSNREYILLKLGPGQLLGEEDFNHDCFNNVYHSFNCQCVSAKGSVLAIKKVDIYRICVVNDWFAKLFHKRCEMKRKWLQERFENHLNKDIQNEIMKKTIQPEKTQRVDDSLFLRLKFLDEEATKHKSTKIQKSQISPERDLTTRCNQRKLALKKLIEHNRKSNPNNDPNCIGMIQYLIKLDRHKQMLLQHSIRLALGSQMNKQRNSSQHTQQIQNITLTNIFLSIRKKQFNDQQCYQLQKMNYQIFLRIRNYEYVNPIFKVEECQITLKTPGSKETEKFIFDNIFQDVTTDDIIKEIGFNQLNKVILVYGQTSSGKSYTLFGDIDNPGIMPLIIKKLLSDKHKLTINYKIIGLDYISNYVTDDMTKINIFDMETVWEYQATFSKQKRKEHLIVTLIIDQKEQIKFVDLAGPERQTKELQEPQKYQEAIWATQQFQVLTKCLNAFSKGKIQSLEDSKLTQQLKFDISTQITLIGTIYPTNSNYDETLSTLQFIDRTRNAVTLPRKESVRTFEITKTQSQEKQIKLLEYENKDLKEQIQRLQQEQKNKLKAIKDILCIEFDLDNLTSLSFKEIQQYKKQQEALIANQNLQIQLNDQQSYINQLKLEITQLKQEIKEKQEKWQFQLVEQKYKNFKINEQFVTQKTQMSEMMRQMQQDKESCIKNLIENSNHLLDEKTNKLFQLPITANLKQLDNNKLQDIKKQIKIEMEQDLMKQLTQMKLDNENNLQQLKQMYDIMLKEKNNEIDQFIQQSKIYREKKKNLIKEMKEEMLQMYEILNKQQLLIDKIENGMYSNGNKILTIPRKDKPIQPVQSQFKHLYHFLERKKSFEIQNKKSSSAEKSFLLTPINRVERSQTTFQEKPIIVDCNDVELFNINEMDINKLKSFIIKLKEMLKKEQNENKIKSEKFKQELAELKKDKEDMQIKYNVESKKYNQQRVTIESQNRLLTKLRPTSSLLRKQS
ncbi:unnamed protein product [Paramecium pentaurelia]|uniref:Kinesin motor domain-containing protein n=1 Tax=Paramecium pentaurelia TaxID=43138 RepID=A0A8S1XQW4_9CILI|nr:unnamed protein product [Paramecium pentaurelia]